MKIQGFLTLFVLLLFVLNTQQEVTEVDNNTFSNYEEVEIVEFNLELNIDFETKSLSGTVVLEMFPLVDNLKQVVLDAWDLDISSISFGSLAHDIDVQEFDTWVQNFCNDDCYQGSSIEIDVSSLWKDNEPIPEHQTFQLYINYGKSDLDERYGYTFVDAKYTKGKKHPIFYTQNEPIYMRSWIPFQDTPMTSTSWTAKITAPSDLKVFMTGIQKKYTDNQDGTATTTYESEDHLIPGYYIGLVVGDFEVLKISEKVYLVAEKENLEDGENLLKNVDSMIQYTEEYINQKYYWNTFTVIIMPDNYPFEGAAHPGLTFISPTLLTQGDYGRDTILHMIASSYFGNVVGPANWSNYWIAQGFATFLRRKIQPQIFGTTYPDMDRMDGNFTMFSQMLDMDDGLQDTFASLHPNTKGINPDDALSMVPYEKGYQFLCHIEEIIGENEMQKFLQKYLKEQALNEVDYEHFKSFLEEYVEDKLPSKVEDIANIDWETWILTPGLPPKSIFPDFTSEEFNTVYSLSNKFIQFSGTSLPSNYDQVEDWHQIQKYAFVDSLLFNINQVDRRMCFQFDNLYDFKNDNDKELQSRWFEFTAILKYTYNDNETFLKEFVSSTGRAKYVYPVYQSLMTAGMHSVAKQLLEENKDWYHVYTYTLLDEVVNGVSVKGQGKKFEKKQRQKINTDL